MTLDVFATTPSGQVQHTSISRLLATSPAFSDFFGLALVELNPIPAFFEEAVKKYANDPEPFSEPRKTAYSLAYGPGQSMFEILERPENAERARIFGGAMHSLTKSDDHDVRRVWQMFDWAACDRPGAVVVDVGGGYGPVSQHIAQNTQHLHLIVQDLPHVVAQGNESLPADVKASGRLSFQAQSFLEPQVALPKSADGKADVVFMRFVMHSWSDKYCRRILANLVPILKPGSKILIFDYVIDESNTRDATKKFGLTLDMIMLVNFNGKERTAEEFEMLFKGAGGRFKYVGTKKPKESVLGVVEAVWEG
jgi:ubiquinone/menaquinone biosynthesis C-methylase UbiE